MELLSVTTPVTNFNKRQMVVFIEFSIGRTKKRRRFIQFSRNGGDHEAAVGVGNRKLWYNDESNTSWAHPKKITKRPRNTRADDSLASLDFVPSTARPSSDVKKNKKNEAAPEEILGG